MTAVPVPAAVIFDVDGTLVDSERDGHRVAFNEAFQAMGMPDRWGVRHYGELLAVAGGKQRLQSYLSSCETSYPDELAGTLHRLKTRFFEQMVHEGRIGLRPGVASFVWALRKERIRLFVATTGTRAWVDPLLRAHFEPGTFEHVVTGTEVPRLKPEPDVYLRVLDLTGLSAGDVLAVEDSANGLEAAHRAGIACVVVRNEYTVDDLSKAALVADTFEADGIRNLFRRH